MQVTKNHFKDLAYICVSGEATSLQQLLVYTETTRICLWYDAIAKVFDFLVAYYISSII